MVESFDRRLLRFFSTEHAFPAAVDDRVAVYLTLLRNNISPSQLFVMSDSTGGGLGYCGNNKR
jgi:hypothetical protein